MTSVASLVVHVAPIETPLGTMLAGATADHLMCLEYADTRRPEAQLSRLSKALGCVIEHGETPIIALVRQQLDEYFRREREEFEIPLDTPGSEFQQRVWSELRRIPWGETRSYGDIAKAIGDSSAAREVGRANGENRIAIVIPCHRVIGADGKLVGYGGGLWRKRKLLDIEARALA
ncbi:MAG TPA: methylated-DNA--[protein]-cysteine S-methyltransferase [Gemmatimonadaceae bacterium]|nr:methylated-DNA--[protein]-cysteine S-methyltransferase [Gemmatimonadaceae bacterium]